MTVRLVTHKDVDDSDVERALAAIGKAREFHLPPPSRRGG
jgi:hypothetical protein